MAKVVGSRIIIGAHRAVIFSWADYPRLSQEQWPYALPPARDIINGLTEGPVLPGGGQYSLALQERFTAADRRWAIRRRFAQLWELGINDPRRLVGPIRYASAKAADSWWAQDTMADMGRIALSTKGKDVLITPEEYSRWNWLDDDLSDGQSFPRRQLKPLDLVIHGKPPATHGWCTTDCTELAPMKRRYWSNDKFGGYASHRANEKGKRRLYPIKLDESQTWLNAFIIGPGAALQPVEPPPTPTDPTR
jgi:hypothetical protein